MKIETFFLFEDNLKELTINKSVVIVDLLRASSTIITALANGAKSIIPAPTVEEAVKIAKNLEKSTYLLCGERNTRIIDGFNLGNSPIEYEKEKIEGKKLILSTTNGTKLFELAKHAKKILIGTTLNASSLVDRMIELDNEWMILCAGRDSQYDESDAIATGLFLSLLYKKKIELELNDASKTSLLIYNSAAENLRDALKKTDHGKILIDNGFESDIDFISQIDKFNLNGTNVNNNIVKE